MKRRGWIVLAAFGLLAAVLFAAYREALRHGFSAREKPWAIEAFVAKQLGRLATGTEAKRMTNPYAPNPDVLAEARDAPRLPRRAPAHRADHHRLEPRLRDLNVVRADFAPAAGTGIDAVDAAPTKRRNTRYGR
jgi:hypothetical protein